jgi:hypothetical protein
MSIGALSISEAPVAAQTGPGSTVKTPPPKRTIIPAADTVAQPEPR